VKKTIIHNDPLDKDKQGRLNDIGLNILLEK
jgi:hypothetical protein